MLKRVAFLFVKDVVDLWYIGYFLYLAVEGSENTNRTKRFATEEIEKQLINSLVNSDTIETEELNEEADTVKKPKDAADIIKKI